MVALILFVTMLYRSQSRLENMLSNNSPENLSKVAIIILGGGLTAGGGVYLHTELRIAKAVELYQQYKSLHAETVVNLIPLSGGTPHKPPPLDEHGFPIAEATAAVKVLLSKFHIPPADIREEPYSLDTLGNAYFLRTLHVDPGRYTELHIVTNDWHMPRTQAMFEHVFSLAPDLHSSSRSSRSSDACPPHASPKLFFVEAAAGLDATLLDTRTKREQASLRTFEAGKHAYTDLLELHTYMFSQHAAYAASRMTHPRVPLDKDVLATY